MSNHIDACPFCGKSVSVKPHVSYHTYGAHHLEPYTEDIQGARYGVVCSIEDGGCGGCGGYYGTVGEAIDNWNARATSPLVFDLKHDVDIMVKGIEKRDLTGVLDAGVSLALTTLEYNKDEGDEDKLAVLNEFWDFIVEKKANK